MKVPTSLVATKKQKSKSLPMSTLTACRGLFLPYKQNPDVVNRSTLVVDNRYATITITPSMMMKRIVRNGVEIEKMVPVSMPNQTTASIVDSIMKNFTAKRKHSNGAIEVVFSPYAVLNDISCVVDESGAVKRGANTNYTWLKSKLREMVRITADVKIKAGGGMTESAIISQFKHPDDEGYDLAPTGKECSLSKHGEVRLWSITFAPGYSMLFLTEWGVNFPTLLPILNSMSAESAAIARYCVSNRFIANESIPSILKALGISIEVTRTLRHHIAKVKADERLLNLCGIYLVERDRDVMVNFDRKKLNRDGDVVWDSMAKGIED